MHALGCFSSIPNLPALAGSGSDLKNQNNQKIKNYYTDGGKTRTIKEAMEYYAQINFDDYDYQYQEKNKSNGCGGYK